MGHCFADEAGSTDHAAQFAAIVDDGLLQCLDDLDLQRERLAEPAPRDRIQHDGCGELGTPQRAEAGIVDEGALQPADEGIGGVRVGVQVGDVGRPGQIPGSAVPVGSGWYDTIPGTRSCHGVNPSVGGAWTVRSAGPGSATCSSGGKAS